MFDNSVGNRSVGVGIPAGQLSPGTGPARTLMNFAEMKTFAIEYVDDQGNRHITLAMYRVLDGKWYLPPNGENFASTLRPLGENSWLAKKLGERLADAAADAAPDAAIPKEDAAKVL